MLPSRTAARASRGVVRVNAPTLRQNVRRFADSAPNAKAGGSGFAGGVAGGVAAATVASLGFYYFTGAGKTAQTVTQMKSYVDKTADSLKVQFKENTPEASEAIETLKQTAYKYATFIPGGRQYVDKVFKDLEVVRNKHGDEVDKLVKDAYGELRSASQKGFTLETASDMWSVLSKYLHELSSLAVDAGQDIMDNHPELKNKLGGSFGQLKQFGDSLGPEAKQKVDETYEEVRKIISQGIQWDTVDRIRKLAQEKVEELKKLGEKAWQKGYEQIQPQLEKNPQVKELVEQNKDVLKKGNITEALEKVKKAVSEGDTGSLNEYIQQAKQKGEQFTSSSGGGGGLDKWLEMIPGGSQILPQLQKLQKVASARGEEAEKLAKETMHDLKQVLDKRSEQLEEVAKKAEKESKS